MVYLEVPINASYHWKYILQLFYSLTCSHYAGDSRCYGITPLVVHNCMHRPTTLLCCARLTRKRTYFNKTLPETRKQDYWPYSILVFGLGFIKKKKVWLFHFTKHLDIKTSWHRQEMRALLSPVVLKSMRHNSGSCQEDSQIVAIALLIDVIHLITRRVDTNNEEGFQPVKTESAPACCCMYWWRFVTEASFDVSRSALLLFHRCRTPLADFNFSHAHM